MDIESKISSLMREDNSLVTIINISAIDFMLRRQETQELYQQIFDKLTFTAKDFREWAEQKEKDPIPYVKNYLSNVPFTFFELSQKPSHCSSRVILECYKANSQEFQQEFNLYEHDIEKYYNLALQSKLKDPRPLKKRLQKAWQYSKINSLYIGCRIEIDKVKNKLF